MRTTPPTSVAQNGCLGDAGCLAMGPRIQGFMITYFSIAYILKLIYMFTAEPR